jgi:hypothetical protein
MGADGNARTLMRYAALEDPQFVLIGGDISYVNGQLFGFGLWDIWLWYCEKEFVRQDRCLIPMILAIGDHEVQGGYGGEPSNAPFYFNYLSQTDQMSYFPRHIGSHASLLCTGQRSCCLTWWRSGPLARRIAGGRHGAAGQDGTLSCFGVPRIQAL